MDIWSWPLSAIGIVGYYLLAEKHSRWGWAVGVLYNVLWILYAIASKQWGFIVVCVFFVIVNARGYQKWEAKKDDSNTGVDSGLTSVRVGNTRV